MRIVGQPSRCPPALALTEGACSSYATGGDFHYTFSKHCGGFTSLVIRGREQLAGLPKLSGISRTPVVRFEQTVAVLEDGTIQLDLGGHGVPEETTGHDIEYAIETI